VVVVTALDLVASFVLEDGKPWGATAADWQREDARAFFDPSGPRMHFETRPRGGRKTTDQAAIGLAWLLDGAQRRARGYCVAVDRDQAALLIDAAGGIVSRTNLSGVIDVESFKITNKKTEASIAVLASDGASAFGLRPNLIVCDELGQWSEQGNSRRLWSALVSALPKVKGSRLVVLTSAADPAHWSYRVLERARVSSRWRVSEVPGPLPWISEEDLAEQREALPAWEYERLHLNRWVAPPDRVGDPQAIQECVTLDGPQEPLRGERYVAALDLGLVRDRSVLMVCHLRGETIVLDRCVVWQGTRARPVSIDEVEVTVALAAREYNGARIVADPWQTKQLGASPSSRPQSVRVFVHVAERRQVGDPVAPVAS
jgi:phage terminase large subunit-like protein